MTWNVSDEEFEAVLEQTAEKQYRYFVGHVADWGELWVLAEGESDWALLEGDPPTLAVWPHERYAEACRQGHWEHRVPRAIEVHEFVDEIIPKVIAAGHAIGVLPLPDHRYTPVEPRQLRSDLEAELSRIE